MQRGEIKASISPGLDGYFQYRAHARHSGQENAKRVPAKMERIKISGAFFLRDGRRDSILAIGTCRRMSSLTHRGTGKRRVLTQSLLEGRREAR